MDQLFSVTYEELRRLASTVRRGDPSATLSPTALVNEAWLKLADPQIANNLKITLQGSLLAPCASFWWKLHAVATLEKEAEESSYGRVR